MSQDTAKIENKLRLLFQKFVESNYILDNYYGDGLINKLSSNDDLDVINLKKTQLLSDLVSEMITKLDKSHITVQVFVIKLCSIISHQETHFTKIFASQAVSRIEKGFSEINTSCMGASLKVAFMELALALTYHASGIKWLLESGAWKNIFNLCSEVQTIFVVRQTYKFAGKFLWKLNDLGDETNLIHVLNLVLQPILTNNYLSVSSMSDTDEAEHKKILEPMLHILLSCFEEVQRIYKPTILMSYLLDHYKISKHLCIMVDRVIRTRSVTYLASKIVFWLSFTKCFMIKPLVDDVKYGIDDLIEIQAIYFNLIAFSINRRCVSSILDFCNACIIIWSQVWGKAGPTFENSKGQKILIQNQLVFVQLVPLLVYVKLKKSCLDQDDPLNEYILKLLDYSCQHTSRAAYAMRSLMYELNPLEITLQSVKSLSCLKNHLNDKQANIIFQAMFYVLQDYDPSDCNEQNLEECYEESLEKVQVMNYVMDTVLLLLNNYDITWHHSIEVICLYSIVYGILKRPNLSCKFVVTALNVISVTIKKFLPPNLSLLLESKQGSAIHEVGKLIYTKMHDLNWEVRDSSLELLHVCTDLSFIKFPPFQKQISENNLINMAATIALNDHALYVQASALKCLAAATKINCLWDQLTAEYPDILDKLISILRHNDEGIVRKEAANVFCEIHQNIKLTPDFKIKLYEHMVSIALTDFHWEVQIAALKFWKIVAESVFTEQGMLDGTFPSMTFSKETRKIVTLNRTEIQKRLVKSLKELASIGCLTVFVKLLQDDVETEILEAALENSKELIEVVNNYEVNNILNQSEAQNIDDVLSGIVEVETNEKKETNEPIADANPNLSDDVIEGILNSDDLNLLSNIYEEHMSLENANKNNPVAEDLVKPKIKLFKLISPVTFVNFLSNKDFSALIEQKIQWKVGIKNVSSLLDDVLGIYEVNEDVNTMDCY